MPYAVSILFALAGVFASLLMLVLLLAGSPNSSPEQWAQMKTLILSVVCVGAVGLIGAVWAMIESRPWIGSAIGGFPVPYCVMLFVFLYKQTEIHAGTSIARALVFVIFAGFGLWLAGVGVAQHFQQSRLLAHARPITARIVKSEVIRSESSDNDPDDLGDTKTYSYRSEIRFRYAVGGAEFESDMLRPTIIVRGYGSHEAAAREAGEYPLGASVTAYVDPREPEKGFLKPERSALPTGFIIVGLLMVPIMWFAVKLI